MNKVKEYLNEKGLDISDFHEEELRQILLGLEAGVDASIYAKPEFNYWQMEEIRFGLMEERQQGR